MRKVDLGLLLIALALVALGLVTVGSASWFVASELYNDPLHFVKRQGIAVALGLVAMVGLTYTPYRKLARWAPLLYGASIAALFLVWVPGIGHTANGATRWFGVGGFNFQPAELAKMVVLICLAAWLHRHRNSVNDLRILGAAGLGIAPVLLLIIAQPDFGSTAIIVGLSALMVFLAGLRWIWLAPIGVVGVVGLMGVMLSEDYRRARLISFMDPCEYSSTTGYQVCQSLVAIHHGGLTGVGLGAGQSKLLFLPEPYNDFIAAVVGEEMGFLGLVGLIGLYGLFAWRGLTIASRAKEQFGALLASTYTAMIVGQACLNLGVTMSIVPPKGLVLPFMSYGSTAMMVNLAAVGVLLSISAEAHAPAPAEAPKTDAGLAPA